MCLILYILLIVLTDAFILCEYNLCERFLISNTVFDPTLISFFSQVSKSKQTFCWYIGGIWLPKHSRKTWLVNNFGAVCMPILGRYSIYTWTCNVNVQRQREKSNTRFSYVSIPFRRGRDVSVKREWMACERETRAWNRSLYVVIFKVTDGIYGLGTNKKWYFMTSH